MKHRVWLSSFSVTSCQSGTALVEYGSVVGIAPTKLIYVYKRYLFPLPRFPAVRDVLPGRAAPVEPEAGDISRDLLPVSLGVLLRALSALYLPEG